MGRLLATALLVAAAGIAIVVAVGPGKDKPKAVVAGTPKHESSHVSPSEPGGQEPLPATSIAAQAPVGATVHMRALRFLPPVVHVHVGQAVRWVNRDNVDHTVYEDIGARSGRAPLFSSDRIAPGTTFRFVFRSPGVIRYVCTLHPGIMHGRIVVTGGEA